MIEKDVTWEPTCNRFYAHFDFLGFKNMTMKYTHEQMVYKLSAIEYFKDNILKGGQYNSHLKDADGLKVFNIGDTVIVITKRDTAKDAEVLLAKCSHFIRMCITNQMPIKGAITHGEFAVPWNDSFVYGAAMVSAVELHDQLHMCGAVLDQNAEKKFKEMESEKVLWDMIVKYKTPMKGGKINHYCLKWMGKEPPTGYPGKSNMDYVEDLYTTASGTPRIYIDNTMDFIITLTDKN